MAGSTPLATSGQKAVRLLYNPFQQCVTGSLVIYSRRVNGHDGSARMGLFDAVVVKTASDRVEGDQDVIKLSGNIDGQPTTWWEPTSNVYDICAPTAGAAAAVVALPPPPSCDGVRRIHFVEASRREFDRRCEAARHEKGRLDTDAPNIADDGRVLLGTPAHTMGVAGLLSHGLPLQHYQLWSSQDGRQANDAFHALGCSSNNSVIARKQAASGVPVNRSGPCQELWSVLRNQVKRSACKSRNAAALAAVTYNMGKEANTTRNTHLSSLEAEDKLKRLAELTQKLKRDLAYSRKRNLDLLADRLADTRPFSLGNEAAITTAQRHSSGSSRALTSC